MKLIKVEKKKWQDREGYSKKIFFEDKKRNQLGTLVQMISIKAGEKVKPHYHKKQTAMFYFLNSNGYFTINNKRVNIEKGDVLVIEPNDKHSSVNNTNENFEFIAFIVDYTADDIFWE